MIPVLAIALSFALLLPPCSSVAAEDFGALPFLKVGSTYRITAVAAQASSASLPSTVKILEFTAGQWVRVEYSPTNTRSLVRPGSDLTPQQMWINFANVAGVREVEKKELEIKEPEKK